MAWAWKHSYALTKNCLRKKFFHKESFVRHGSKNLLSLKQRQGVETRLKMYLMRCKL